MKGVKNHRVVVSRHGEPDVLLVVVEEDLPEPGAGEVRVKVLARAFPPSISHTDAGVGSPAVRACRSLWARTS